jgi:hypothetical protein
VPANCRPHEFVSFHEDGCHKYSSGLVCESCGKRTRVTSQVRDFRSVHSAWWHWGRAGCVCCEALMRQAGLHPDALADEDLACREIDRQWRETENAA